MKLKLLIIFFFLSATAVLFGQKNVTTFGLQYKPIIPNRLIGMYEQEFNQDQFLSSVKQIYGHSFGGVIRHGFTNTISIETGINMTRRNFGLNFTVPDSSYDIQSRAGLIGYEIPLSVLIYIRLGEQLYMNTSLGTSLLMFPSDIRKTELIKGTQFFSMEAAYKSKMQGALIANFGFEYRTRSSGYFYIGSSYLLPFAPIVNMAMAYEYEGGDKVSVQSVRGSYLTLDLRYFFHENPE